MPRSDAAAPAPALEAPVDLAVGDRPAHAKKEIKRSYSSTSIASLPTPPRTRKRKRSSSRHSRATDSDDEDGVPVLDSDDEEILGKRRKEASRDRDRDTLVVGHKKRRLQVDAIAAELAEDAFWGVESEHKSSGAVAGSSKDATHAPSRPRTPEHDAERSPSCSPAAHLLKRNATGLLSPPRSRRHKSPRVLPFPLPAAAAARAGSSEPRTPPRRTRAAGRTRTEARSVRRRLFPERDSPNNPFLDDKKDGGSDVSATTESPDAGEAEPKTPQPYTEKPTVTYVFRGQRTEFMNPLYDPRYPETGVAPPEADPDDPSKLPVEDLEFEASAYCPPKVLFPEAHKKSKRKRQERSDSEDSEADGPRATSSTVVAEEPPTPESNRKPKGKGRGRGTGTGKGKAVARLDTIDEEEPVEADAVAVAEKVATLVKRKAKSRAAATKKAPPKKSSVPPEWESTDDEGGGHDEDEDDPVNRIGLPRGFVPKPKERAPAPAPASRPRTRSASVRRSEEPPRAAEAGEVGDPVLTKPPSKGAKRAAVKA